MSVNLVSFLPRIIYSYLSQSLQAQASPILFENELGLLVSFDFGSFVIAGTMHALYVFHLILLDVSGLTKGFHPPVTLGERWKQTSISSKH